MSFELVILCEQPGSETSHSVWGQSVRGNGIWKGLTAQYIIFYRNIFNIQLCQILWWHVWGWVDNLTVETHLVEALLVGWGHPPHLQTPPQSSDASQTVSPKGFVLRPLHKIRLEELARFYQQLSFFPKSILKFLCVFLRVMIFSDITSNKGPGPFVKTALDIFLRSYFFLFVFWRITNQENQNMKTREHIHGSALFHQGLQSQYTLQKNVLIIIFVKDFIPEGTETIFLQVSPVVLEPRTLGKVQTLEAPPWKKTFRYLWVQ